MGLPFLPESPFILPVPVPAAFTQLWFSSCHSNRNEHTMSGLNC